jgi:hypothetical protein
MSSRELVRWGGLSLLVGGVLSAIGIAVGSFLGPADALQEPVSAIVFLGVILLLLGLPALYTVLARSIGVLGLIGYVLFFASGVLAGAGGTMLGIIGPALMRVAPGAVNGPPPPEINNFFMVAGTLGLVGGVLFGATIVRAGAPERFAGMLLILGSVVGFVGGIFDFLPHLGDLGTVLTVLALGWMGWTLMTRHVAEMEPSRAPAEGTARARA